MLTNQVVHSEYFSLLLIFEIKFRHLFSKCIVSGRYRQIYGRLPRELQNLKFTLSLVKDF